MRVDTKTYPDAATLHRLGANSVAEVRDPDTNALIAYDISPDVNLSGYTTALLAIKSVVIIEAAAAACDGITNQIVPDATHQTAYTNAATIVWANGGNAPSTDPAKSVFAAQGASVGISDPATFAKVVTGVSLASMQLATLLGTLKGGVESAKSIADLSSALSAFESAAKAFVDALNGAGLTAEIKAPAEIIIPGVNG